MNKSVGMLSEHEVYIRDLLISYKNLPVLWQPSHPQYRNRAERNEAYTLLARKCQSFNSEADEDYVRSKIDSLRSAFRKERRKVLKSKQQTEKPEDVYKPSLWYYDLLLFTAGEEPEEGEKEEGEVVASPEEANTVKIPFWTREYSAILINFYKCHPCLYSTSNSYYKSKRRRVEALKKITDNLSASTGKRFSVQDVRRKISLLRGQFLHEFKKVKNSDENEYKPTLWCYEMLNFLNSEYCNKKQHETENEKSQMNLRGKGRQRKNSTSDSDSDMDIKKESDLSVSSESVHTEVKEVQNDDIYDTIAKNLAHKLRDMTAEQRTIANRIVRDVMYHGQMENLMPQSRLSLDGT